MKKAVVQYYGTQLLSMMRNTDIVFVQFVILVGAAGIETKVMINRKLPKNKTNIPELIHDIIRSIFDELSKDELLSKCLHRTTQNANESLNNLIWSKCPKRVFIKREVLAGGFGNES